MNEITIPIDKIGDKFNEHLSIEGNNRIIFSGKYGIGKTYFLNKFFENKNDEYDVYHIFPVNYQISSNDDIFNFLKYDILIELINKNENIFKDIKITSFLDYSILTYLYLNNSNNLIDILKSSFDYIQKLGHNIPDLVNITEKFISFKKELENGEKGIIDDFVSKIKETKITETDLLSQMIKEKIIIQKSNKISVLILDDLDRIDPEHIFRLLNIFGAHFDSNNIEFSNKFGFDKIILVGDINNIKSIFHHKYGKDADFNGYIDKFFSIEKFNFNNDLIVETFTDNIIEKLKIKNTDLSNRIKDKRMFYNMFINSILKQCIHLDGKYKLNLRELLKATTFHITPLNSQINYDEIFVINTLIDTLKTLIGDESYFVEILQKIKEKNLKNKYKSDDLTIKKLNKIYGFFIYHIYVYILNKDDIDFSNNQNVTFKDFNFSLNYQFQNIENIDENLIYDLFYDLLIKYISNYKK